jgi:hypothetical protein
LGVQQQEEICRQVWETKTSDAVTNKANRRTHFDITEELFKTPAQITLGQLLEISPATRAELKRGISREERRKRIVMAVTSNKAANYLDDHLIKVKCNMKNIDAIIDGGANCCVINSNVLNPNELQRVVKTDIIIRLADGTITRPMGLLEKVELEICTVKLTFDFLVMQDPGYAMLLGRDFLSFVKARTDWQTNEYTFNINGVLTVKPL